MIYGSWTGYLPIYKNLREKKVSMPANVHQQCAVKVQASIHVSPQCKQQYLRFVCFAVISKALQHHLLSQFTRILSFVPSPQQR